MIIPFGFLKKKEDVGLVNFYTDTDAAGDDSNSTGNWGSSGVDETSVVSTDIVLGDNFALKFVSNNSNSFQQCPNNFTGLTIGVEYIATIRTRRTSGDGGIFNWSSVSGDTYDIVYSGSNWIEGTVIFTPTASTISIRIYASADIGAIGSTIEVSSIVINEN